MSDFLRTVAKYSDAQPRWPEGTSVDTSTGAGGGRWRSGNAPRVRAENVLEGYSEHARLNEQGWIVTSSVDDAVKALNEGKHVELKHVREVATLLDKLAAIATAAEALGEKAPIYDLCKVSVKGTNLFCADAFDIERDKMPQFLAFPKPGSEADKLPRRPRGTVDAAPAFLEHLKRSGYSVEETEESASFLRASQRQLNGAKVGQMIRRMREPNNPFNDAPPLVVSEDNYIIDGHHRWAAHVGIDAEDNELGDLKIPVIRVNIRVLQLLEEANAFTKAFGMLRANIEGSLQKTWLRVVKEAVWREEDHPRGKTTPESTPGSFAPRLQGPAKLTVESWEYKRPSVRNTFALNVLYNPTVSDLKRWAGREVTVARYLPLKDGGYVFWDAGEALHQQVAAALGQPYKPFEGGEAEVSLIERDEPELFPVRKSWLSSIVQFFKDAAAWQEIEHPRGKTTPESNTGSFRPKNSMQGELFNFNEGVKGVIDEKKAELKGLLHNRASVQKIVTAATELAKLKAWEKANDILSNEDNHTWITSDMLLNDAMAPMVEAYLIAEQRDKVLDAETPLYVQGMLGSSEVSEVVRKDLAFGDEALRHADSGWYHALDHYIGSGYDEINGYFRGESGQEIDESSDSFTEYVSQYMNEHENDALAQAQESYISENVNDWINEDERWEELNARLLSQEITQEQFESELADLRSTITDEKSEEFYDSDYYSDAMSDLQDKAKEFARYAMEEDKRYRIGEAEEQALEIKELINSRPATPITLRVHRGVKTGASINWDGLKAGDAITLSGFTSASSKREVAERFSGSKIIEFVIPAGTKDVLFTTNDGEGEIIFNHGMQGTVLHRGPGRLVVYLDPAGDGDDPEEDEVGKADTSSYVMNFGRLHTEPTLVPVLPVLKAEWNEEDHPRGKTTPESNEGSFRPLGDDSYRTPKEEFTGPYPAVGDWEAPETKAWRAKEKQWDRSMMLAITDGRITQEEARKLGFITVGGEEYKPLPDTLYHVTTAYDRVQAEGLRTREEHGGNSGIGGGSSDTISLTTDLAMAEAYYDGLRSAHSLMSGEKSVQDLLGAAKEGEGAKKEWYSGLVDTYRRESNDELDGLPLRLYDAIHGTETWAIPEGLRGNPNLPKIMEFWGVRGKPTQPIQGGAFMQRIADPEHRKYQKSEFLNRWLFWREQAGGPANPVFFTNNWEQFAAKPLQSIRLLEVAPQAGAQGYFLPGESEFRVHSGAVLPVRRVIKEWREEEHPRGKTTPESNKGSFTDKGSTGFVSPNIDENVSFDEATARQSSERTKLLQSAAQEAAQFFGVTAHDQVGVGAWADGAEQSLIIGGEGDPESFKAYMAFLGLISEQKAVVDFTNDSSGPDAVFRMSVGNRPLKTVHEMLLKAGVQFHTLRQSDHSVDVFVFAPGMEQETTDAVARAAQEFGVGVAAIRGRGEFVGSWDTREEGRARYEEILDAHGRRVHGHDGGWQALRDRWWGRLQAVRKSWLQVVKEWREEDHPRGKTTPESNSGSFAPSITSENVVDIYHGSSAEVLPLILKHGLKPGSHTGVRRWEEGDFYVDPVRRDSVFVTTKARSAVHWAKRSAIKAEMESGQEANVVILKVEMPKDLVTHFVTDQLASQGEEVPTHFMWRGEIPPEFIKGYVELDYSHPLLGTISRSDIDIELLKIFVHRDEALEVLKGETVTLYVPIVLLTNKRRTEKSWLDTLLKYIPTQPRWPEGTPVDESTGAGGGRWAPSTENAGYSFPKDENGKPVKGEQWRDKQGNPVSPEIAARIKAAGIPAGYHDIVLNADPTAPCLAIGKDSKGREKRFFSKAWHDGQAMKKWEEAKRFNQALPEIRRKVEQALDTARGKDLIAAQVLYVLDQTGYRIGGGEDELAEKDSFGITTITSSHVKVNGDKVSFNFPGKKGVQLTKTIEDRRLANIVRNAKADARRNQPIFDVSASKVNSYFKELTGQTFSAKDIRTWHGTTMAIIEMGKWKTRPRTEKEFAARQRVVLDKVASWLGNTRAVAKSSYVDPNLWDWWRV